MDVLICASGFDTSFRPRFPIFGREELNLQDFWADMPKSYLGIAVSGFPNFFLFLGPHSPVGNGPTLVGIGTEINLLKIIEHIANSIVIRSSS